MTFWSKVRLKNLCVDAGQYGLNISAENYVETGVRLLRTTDISSGTLTTTEEGVFVSGLPEARFTLEAGDLLLSRSGTPPGQSYLVRAADAGATFAGYLVRFRPLSSVEPRFLAYVARSEPFQHTIRSESVASTIQNFNAERYANIEFRVPDSVEQCRIADFLDAETARIDEMRHCSQRQVELLGYRFKEFMRQETTVGQGPTTETGVPWMPMMHHRWQLHKVSQEFRTASGTTPTSSDTSYFGGPYPWVNSTDVRDGLIRQVEKSVTKKALLDFSALKVHPAGALVVALYGQGTTKGRVGILGMDSCLNQACCALVPVGRISTEYAYYWFRAHKDGIVAQAVGAGQPNLSQELVRQLRIPAPNVAMQLQITSRLRDVERSTLAQVSQLERRGALLAERRQALITAAVTGQFDVSTASGRNVTDGVTA
ncbi:restriction endonuclease subunit S [Streptomyces hygroscopicus]|uniref:restriction endonuclease subunit S n=1 Tax=Streptomyces hygroscopicus TaxID=1912 RepID=UPI002240BF70|nr:restriction endonuclease subunit S [Streptomyces hygroscopicus]